jgi:hypothetical protein
MYGAMTNTALYVNNTATRNYMYVSPRIYSPSYEDPCQIYVYDRIDNYENGGANKTWRIVFTNNVDGTYDYQAQTAVPAGVHFTVEEDDDSFVITFDREMICSNTNLTYLKIWEAFVCGDGASLISSFDGIYEYDEANSVWNYANL